jgi:hypothetical protein
MKSNQNHYKPRGATSVLPGNQVLIAVPIPGQSTREETCAPGYPPEPQYLAPGDDPGMITQAQEVTVDNGHGTRK